MNYSDKWLGYMGAGFSASVIGGLSVYQINMWNMGGGAVPMPVLIFGKRLGVMAQADANHAFCLITGVSSPSAFTEIKASGADWTLSFGGDVDSVVKSTGKVWKVLKAAASSTGNWAAQESAKKAVQGVMGDFTLKPSGPNFVLLPSPVGVGIGAGIFYEWQTLTKVGTDVAWRYVKPNWWLANEGGKVMLHMNSIPEANGTAIGLQFRIKGFGADDLIIFDSKRTGMVNMRSTNKLKTVRGTVHGGALCARGSTTPGLNLSELVPAGRTEIGFLSTSRNTEVTKNGALQIGLGVNRNAHSETNLYKWESDDYASVQTNANGQMSATSDTRKKK